MSVSVLPVHCLEHKASGRSRRCAVCGRRVRYTSRSFRVRASSHALSLRFQHLAKGFSQPRRIRSLSPVRSVCEPTASLRWHARLPLAPEDSKQIRWSNATYFSSLQPRIAPRRGGGLPGRAGRPPRRRQLRQHQCGRGPSAVSEPAEPPPHAQSAPPWCQWAPRADRALG
jgi:hypothetical protein